MIPEKQAIVGKYSFAHESGIHTHAVLSNPWTYEPYPPELVGSQRSLSIGKQSGKNVVKHMIIQRTGIVPSDEVVLKVLARVKAVYSSGRRKSLEDWEFVGLLRELNVAFEPRFCGGSAFSEYCLDVSV